MLRLHLSSDLVTFCKEEENMLKREDVVSDFKQFMDKNEERLAEEYNRDNQYQTSVRGFINRGNFASPEEAEKYAKELHEELNRKVSTSAYEAVLERKDIKVFSILKVDAGELEPTQTAEVEVTIDIEPEFDLPAYKEYELNIEPTEVKDEEVDKELVLLFQWLQ